MAMDAAVARAQNSKSVGDITQSQVMAALLRRGKIVLMPFGDNCRYDLVVEQDGLFFRKFAEVHPRYKTPGFSILAQGLWAVVLVLSGSYETLLDYAMFAMWFWYGLMVAGVIVLRYKQPDLARPYRMWGYPVTPALFVAIACWFLVNMLNTRPVPSVAGLLLIATGIPVYFLWARQSKQAESTTV